MAAEKRRIDSRAKGVKAEIDVANYFVAHGWPDARRTVAAGWRTSTRTNRDRGDIVDTDPFCVQVKNTERPMIGLFLTNTWEATEVQAGPHRIPVIVEKRTGYADVGMWWLHTSSRIYVDLIAGSPQFTLPDHLMRAVVGDLIGCMRNWAQLSD